MNFLITGLPGVGKGTQSENIEKKYNAKHLSTGNLFRGEIKSGSELGKELSSYMNGGLLVPDELTIKILAAEIKKPEYNDGFLLDGFPRTINQAVFLDEMLDSNDLKLDAVIALHLDESTIISRLTNRLFCPNCQSVFHKIYSPPKVENVCDKCGHTLEQRDDDKLTSVTKRLEVAKSQTLPVIEHYEKVKLVININMNDNDSEQNVFSKITNLIDGEK
ncbi:MAG: nucleoside monophosphate kinase [Spiroplasma sp.]|nr:nucleoside monophosphate kinase [Mycoplasmatales bacterium]